METIPNLSSLVKPNPTTFLRCHACGFYVDAPLSEVGDQRRADCPRCQTFIEWMPKLRIKKVNTNIPSVWCPTCNSRVAGLWIRKAGHKEGYCRLCGNSLGDKPKCFKTERRKPHKTHGHYSAKKPTPIYFLQVNRPAHRL